MNEFQIDIFIQKMHPFFYFTNMIGQKQPANIVKERDNVS